MAERTPGQSNGKGLSLKEIWQSFVLGHGYDSGDAHPISEESVRKIAMMAKFGRRPPAADTDDKKPGNT